MKSAVKKSWAVLILLGLPFFVKGDHLTGGDFTVTHVEDNTFLATLSLYRDCGSFGAPFDEFVEITVFDAVTDEHLSALDFLFIGFETIDPNLGNTCFEPDICLEIGVYEMEIELPDNPNGYYLSKERCCRSDLSINLFGINLGFVFTVDVPDPALANSSPQFGEYPGDAFFCVNEQNTIDFGAIDPDGDSLVYSFTDPYAGNSSFFDPNPVVATPKPYEIIFWETGFDTDNQVGGTPPMSIDPQTGVIIAQPDQVGIFTIAVQVEEFRDGILIGTVRREIQLLSVVCVDAAFTYDIIDELEVSFTDQSPDGNSWFWEFGDGATSTEQNPTHSYAVPGSYTVTLTVDEGCSVSEEIQLITTDVFEQEKTKFSFYPNPTNGVVYIENSTLQMVNLAYNIRDLSGRLLISRYAAGERLEIETSELSSGIYLLTVRSVEDNILLFSDKLTVAD